MDNWKTSSTFNGKTTQRLQIPNLQSLSNWLISGKADTTFNNWLTAQHLALPAIVARRVNDVIIPSTSGFLAYTPNKGDANYREPKREGEDLPPINYDATVFHNAPAVTELGMDVTNFILDVVVRSLLEFDGDMQLGNTAKAAIPRLETYTKCVPWGIAQPSIACYIQAAMLHTTAEAFTPYRILLKYGSVSLDSYNLIAKYATNIATGEVPGHVAYLLATKPQFIVNTSIVELRTIAISYITPYDGTVKTRNGGAWRLTSRDGKARTSGDILDRLDELDDNHGAVEPPPQNVDNAQNGVAQINNGQLPVANIVRPATCPYEIAILSRVYNDFCTRGWTIDRFNIALQPENAMSADALAIAGAV